MKRKHLFQNVSPVVSIFIAVIYLSYASNADAVETKRVDIQKKVTDSISKKIKQREIQGTRRSPDTATAKGPLDPDLRARRMSTTYSNSAEADGWNVQIAGRIENEGGGDFVSAPGSAEARIVLHLPGLSGPDAWPILKRVPITRINSGRFMNISETFDIREYQPSFLRWAPPDSAGSGECPARLNIEFIIQVTYDPDLHNDGNEQNDDDDHSNDQTTEISNRRYIARCP
jgi:hypothetical protein